MAVKKIEELNIHRDVNSTEQFDVQGYLNENWDKMQDVVDNNAKELMQVQKDISTLKEDNKTNKSRIDVLEKSNETRDGKISKNTEDIEAIQGSIKTATETINKKDNEQDEDIKANKESIEELQAENLEIKAENERLREDIKSIATIGEASGENIHLEDSSDARCELEICGNHQQDTREGYNQFKITSTQTQSAGVTITKIDESSVSYQGTTAGMFTHMLVEYDGKGLEITKQMYLKAFGNLTNAILSVKLIKNGKTESSYLRVSPDLILSAGDVLQQIYVQQQNTGILISGTLQVLLTDYENKDKPYEQYGASPSIDFLSELKAVGDDINILNDTIFARKGYHSGIVGATIQKVNTTIRLLTDEDINVISNKDITISLGTDKDLKYNVFEIDENDVIIKNNMSSNNKDKTIKLQENTKKISLMLMWQDANKTIILEDIKDCKIKIAYGTSINNYSSYNCGSAKVDIVNKNIFKEISNKKDIKKAYFNIIGGILNIKKGEICIISFDTNNNQGGLYLNEDIFLFQGNYSVTCDGKRHYLIGKVKDQINTNVTILKTNKETTNNYDISNVLVTKYDASNVDTKYIKHQEQSYLVDVQQPMFEGDKFIKTDGKWYEKHCVKTEIMLTFPTTNIEVCGTFANFQTNRNIAFAVVKNDLKITNVRNDILCDKLKAKDNSMWGGKEEGIQTYINSNKFMISIPFEDIEKNFGEELTINNYSQAFRKYINDNGPFKIYYLLEEPELVECTEAQNKVLDEIYSKAHTYKNITNISAESAEVNPIVNVKYLKDTETEHNKLQAQINEIKELLSSTETSALLINNLEKDLRMEVE
nr:MAG TPA: endonuclease subunit [Caudoviricetes sp.]